MSERFTAAEMLDLARLFQDLARSPGLRGMEDQVSLVLSRDDLTRLAALLVGESESVSNARAEALREAEAEVAGALKRVMLTGREAVAQWMLERSYATGHGDTIDDLLGELRAAVRAEALREAVEANAKTEPLARLAAALRARAEEAGE